MRPAVSLALILPLLAAASAASVEAADPPRRPPPSMPAAPSEHTSAGVITLRTPGPDAVLIRASSFIMGSSESEIGHAVTLCKLEPGGEACVDEIAESFLNESAAHEVYLSDYWIDRTEVTLARYRQCVAAGACDEPPYASGGRRYDRPDFPVVLVTWNDADRFCAWTGGRLPTEAEWERAARGGSQDAPGLAPGRRYPWGNVYNPFHTNHGQLALDTNLDANDAYLELAPAASFPHGRTPDGIDDLAGNVEEWVADYYAPEYPPESARDPRGPDAGEERVVRGGSYSHGRPWLRAAARLHDSPTARRAWRGFRCARSPEQAPKPLH